MAILPVQARLPTVSCLCERLIMLRVVTLTKHIGCTRGCHSTTGEVIPFSESVYCVRLCKVGIDLIATQYAE